MTQHGPSSASIAYIYPQRYHFVAKDIEALRDTMVVDEHRFSSGPTWLLAWDLLRQAIFLLRCRLKGIRHAFIHFAGYHSVLPTLFGFRTHIIIAGSDACSFPGIGYGSFRKPLMARAMAYSMRNAKHLLPVHASLKRFRNCYSDLGPVDQGYEHFVHCTIAPTIPIPYGFDAQQWQILQRSDQRQGVLCVATGALPGNAVHYRKGVDLLLEAASNLPDHRFTVIGAVEPRAYQGLPDNVRILGKCTPDDLRKELLTHAIYAQPSVMEGFPNALCEAMLMGCIPVVSSITSMPAIVGDVGEIVQRRTSTSLISAIRRISSLPFPDVQRRQEAARDRILEFTLERRTKALKELLQETTA